MAEVLALPSVANTIGDAGIRKAVDVSTPLSVTRSHIDLKLLIFWWSIERNTFVTSWRSSAHTDYGHLLNEGEERTLWLLKAALRVSKKSWIWYFREREECQKGVMVEALPLYWLSRIVFPSGLEDSINSYVFSIANRFTKGDKLALRPIYLGLMYARLDECANNTLILWVGTTWLRN